jgi:hypothetical protein
MLLSTTLMLLSTDLQPTELALQSVTLVWILELSPRTSGIFDFASVVLFTFLAFGSQRQDRFGRNSAVTALGAPTIFSVNGIFGSLSECPGYVSWKFSY